MTLLDATGRIPNTRISLSTRKGREIENIQGWSLAADDFKKLEDVLRKYEKQQARKVGGCCPVYNCHGLAFASRRTAISEADVPKFLDDDGFTNVSEKAAQEGDLVVYHERTGEICHTGLVVGRMKQLIQTEAAQVTVPLIWSKWGKGPEMVHPVYACLFFEGEEYVRYYRMDSWEDGWRR